MLRVHKRQMLHKWQAGPHRGGHELIWKRKSLHHPPQKDPLSPPFKSPNRTLENYAGNFSLVKEGMTDEEAHQEASRCLRCDHFGFGSFKGGRKTEW